MWISHCTLDKEWKICNPKIAFLYMDEVPHAELSFQTTYTHIGTLVHNGLLYALCVRCYHILKKQICMSLSSSNLLVYPLLLHIVSASSPTHLLALEGWEASRWQIWSTPCLMKILPSKILCWSEHCNVDLIHLPHFFFISYFEGWSPDEGLSHCNLPSLSRSMREPTVRSLNLKVWAPWSKVNCNVMDGNI